MTSTAWQAGKQMQEERERKNLRHSPAVAAANTLTEQCCIIG